MKEILEKIGKVIGEPLARILLSAFGIGLDGAILTGFVDGPFYHSGWTANNRGWLILFLVVFLAASLLLFRRWGLLIVIGLCFIGAVLFGLFYGKAGYQGDSWPLITWLIYGNLLAMITALIARVLLYLYVRYMPGVKPTA